MPYIHFTDEQKRRANEIDLPDFLRRQGEKLLRSGPEFRMASDHSVTVRGNRWYDHAVEKGGGPVSFLQTFYGLSYPEAVSKLLGGELGEAYRPAPKVEPEKKKFVLPPANRDMRRTYAYLLGQRKLDRDVLNRFVRAGLIYESAEPSADGSKVYHNAVFVGKDEHGVPRHAHKHGLCSFGPSFKRNVSGCDARYSFHQMGLDSQLYVFEAPIDLLSFISLYPDDWTSHSYVALCGTGGQALMWMLEQNPMLLSISLCLDNDEAGIRATERLTNLLTDKGYNWVGSYVPKYKDWNDDLVAQFEQEQRPSMTMEMG